MDRGAQQATVHGVAKSRTRLSDWTELNWMRQYPSKDSTWYPLVGGLPCGWWRHVPLPCVSSRDWLACFFPAVPPVTVTSSDVYTDQFWAKNFEGAALRISSTLSPSPCSNLLSRNLPLGFPPLVSPPGSVEAASGNHKSASHLSPSSAAFYPMSENLCFIYSVQLSSCLTVEGKSSSCYSIMTQKR